MIQLTKPVRRVTRDPFFTYGPDRDRRFVAALAPVDLLVLRPLRSRAGGTAEISIKLCDVYRYALQCRINCARLEKSRAVKAKKDAARKTRALARAVKATA